MKRALVSVASLLVVVLAASNLFAQVPDASSEPAPPPASAVPETPPAPPPVALDRPAAHGVPRYDFIRINAGLRMGYIPNRAFDAFSSNDVLPQFSLDATYPLLKRDRLVLGVGLGWDVGGHSDTVRGLPSSINTQRFSAVIEGRYNVTPWLFAFGKLAPGAAVMTAHLKDPSVPDDLSATGWAFSGDASIGASVLMGPRSSSPKRVVRFWLTPEIGYAYTTAASIDVNPNRNPDLVVGSDAPTNLHALALSGFFWRASMGTTF
jgi:hypothetical protein